MAIKDKTLFHPHQPLQVPDGKRRLGAGDVELRETLPTLQRFTGGLDGVLGGTQGY